MADSTALTLLLAACWLHAGFQLSVTTLVYPALAAVPQDQWRARHAVHSRRITPVVVVVYAAVLLAGAMILLAGPLRATTLTALGASALALVLTAAFAAPAHARLTRGRDDTVVSGLLRIDRLRLLAVLVAAAAASLAAG
ncbi:MAG: hypothetical protein H0T66_03700 [Geodermatophilaceae bacterium]|nr:hypothetical protein [Geodermatophilaceae bacterium]